MLIKLSLLTLGVAVALAGCGGGGGGIVAGDVPTPAVVPFKIADFSVGKLKVTGDTVLKPSFSNTGWTQCVFNGTLAGLQAALSPLLSQNLWNCPQLRTPGITLVDFGSGVGPQNIATSPVTSSINHPIRTVGDATAGQVFSIENFGAGNSLSTLTVGQARATSNNYRWSNYPSSSTGMTTLNFSYATTTGSLPSGLQAPVQHKINVSVQMYWYDQFNQTQSQSFPILTQNFDNEFTKSITFSVNPADYPFPHALAAFELTTDITSLTMIGRTN
jgi:hypothetical protein